MMEMDQAQLHDAISAVRQFCELYQLTDATMCLPDPHNASAVRLNCDPKQFVRLLHTNAQAQWLANWHFNATRIVAETLALYEAPTLNVRASDDAEAASSNSDADTE